MTVTDIVEPVARLLVQKGDRNPDGTVDFFEFESTPQRRTMSGTVGWAASSNEDGPIVTGTLSVEFRNMTFELASLIRPDAVVGLELGYISGSPILPRIVFWGFLDDLLPSIEGPETIHTLKATAFPWEIAMLEATFSIRDTDARFILETMMATAGISIVEDAEGILDSLGDISIPRWTTTGTLEDSIHALFHTLIPKLGFLIGYAPEFGDFNTVRLIRVNAAGEQENPPEVQAVNLRLEDHAFHSAGVRTSRAEQVHIFDSTGIQGPDQSVEGRQGAMRTVDGLPVDADEKIKIYEYDLSTPTDPRVRVGNWVVLSGLPVGRVQQPAVFNVMSVSHRFGDTDWSTAYRGPLLASGISDRIVEVDD